MKEYEGGRRGKKSIFLKRPGHFFFVSLAHSGNSTSGKCEYGASSSLVVPYALINP